MLQDEKKSSCECLFGNCSIFANSLWYLVGSIKKIDYFNRGIWKFLLISNWNSTSKRGFLHVFLTCCMQLERWLRNQVKRLRWNFPPKKVNSFRSLDNWMGSECTFGWHRKGVLCNLSKSYVWSNQTPKRIRKDCFSWKSPKWCKTLMKIRQLV